MIVDSNPFNTLPNELIDYIFYLSDNKWQGQVCKLFRVLNDQAVNPHLLEALASFKYSIGTPKRREGESDRDYIVRSVKRIAKSQNQFHEKDKVGFKQPAPLSVVVKALVKKESEIEDTVLCSICMRALNGFLYIPYTLGTKRVEMANHYRKQIEKKRKTITVLNLSNQSLKRLPKEIGRFTQVQVLYLSNNQLNFLPFSIKHLKKLKEIHLKDNQFTEFPKVLLRLKELKTINLSNNQLTAIPDKITGLTNLRSLIISENKFPGKLRSRKDAKQLRSTIKELKNNGCATRK